MADDNQVSDLPLPQPYIDAIKGFEGFTPKAQWDYAQHSNGYGTRARYPGEVIDQQEATDRLHRELGSAAAQVDAYFPDLPEGHRAALTSLTYNAGPGWMRGGLGAAVQAGDWDTAKRLFLGYNHAGGQVLPGLVNRRGAEAAWLSGAMPGPGAAPSPNAVPSALVPPMPVGGFAGMRPQGTLPQSSLAPPTGGVQAALAGLGSPSSGDGTLAGIGKSLMTEAGKTKGLPFPDAKLKPFDENWRPLPLNLPNNFAAMAQIPKFAEGGIVDRPTVAMVGENGPEAIVPLSRSAGGSFPYLGMLEQAGRFMSPADLPDQPSVNIQRRLGRSRVPMHIGRSIPGFAEGGIVDRPTVAMVGENGPEAIVPLSGMVGSGATSDPFAAAAARIRAPYTHAARFGPHTGLTDIARYFGEQGRSVATAPLRALTGQMQVTDPETGMPTPEARQEGMGFAGTIMSGAMPFAERGALGMAGGKLSGMGEALSKLRAAFDSIRAAQGNVGIAPISELIAQSGFSKEAVHKALLDAAQRGEVTLHQGNQAGESQIIRDAAISFPGEPPLKYVFFKDKPKGVEPKSREEIRRELREGMARSKLGGPGKSTFDLSDRIDFQSTGAQRDPGKVPAERQSAIETPEAMAKRKAEMKAAFDELMKKGKPEKAKAAPSASGRIGFKSLGTER